MKDQQQIYARYFKRFLGAAITLGATGTMLTFTPTFRNLRPHNTLSLLAGSFCLGVSSVLWSVSRRPVNRFFQINRAIHETDSAALAGQATLDLAMIEIENKTALSLYLEGLPQTVNPYWHQYYGIPTLNAELIQDTKPALNGTLTLEKSPVVQRQMPSHLETLLRTLINDYPQLVRVDNWIVELVDTMFHPKLTQRRGAHLAAFGGTQSGKTTLVSYMANLAAGRYPTEVFIHDPKKVPNLPDVSHWRCGYTEKYDGYASSSEWILRIRDIRNECMERYSTDPDSCPEVILIQDEWNAIYEATKAGGSLPKDVARQVVSENMVNVNTIAGAKGHQWIIGQSPLQTNSGISRAMLQNFTLMLFGNTATYGLKHPDMLALSADKVDILAPLADLLVENDLRFALVRPPSGQTFLGLIPAIE